MDYQDRQLFTNSTAYNTNLYLYYILTEQRDLFIDYGNRYTSLSNGEYDIDNSIRGGVSGRVFGPFNGSLQVGASRRTPYNGPDKNPFNTFSGSGSLTWNVNRKVTLSSDLARDFSTTATAVSLESSTAGFTLQDSFSNKAVGTIAATVGQNRFLGVEGEVAPHNAQRVDDFYSLSGFYSYAYNEHLKVQLGASYYRSWSNVSFADFPREQYHITLISHW